MEINVPSASFSYTQADINIKFTDRIFIVIPTQILCAVLQQFAGSCMAFLCV